MTDEINQPALEENVHVGLNGRNIIGILSLLLLAFAYSCKSNNTPAVQQAQQSTAAVVDTVAAANDTLQAQNNSMRIVIDELNTDKAAADSQLTVKEALIARLEKELRHYKGKNRHYLAELKRDRKLIASLQGSEKENSDRIDLLSRQNSDLQSERDSITKSFLDLKQLASVLHASDIRLAALHLKHGGKKEKKTARARKANVLRIYFDIDENRIAENGTKNLYLVVTGPDGTLLGNNAAGTFTATNGQQMNYSILKQIYLKQNEPVKDVTADWKQSTRYKKGMYNIAIYNGGYKIGEGSVKLS